VEETSSTWLRREPMSFLLLKMQDILRNIECWCLWWM
jgi:hypothetical protein